jgi:hypothetical protein
MNSFMNNKIAKDVNNQSFHKLLIFLIVLHSHSRIFNLDYYLV